MDIYTIRLLWPIAVQLWFTAVVEKMKIAERLPIWLSKQVAGLMEL